MKSLTLKPLALACAFLAAVPAVAQTAVPSIVITGARFPAATTPIGATVITAEQIRTAGATDVNEAIRKIGGVFGRQSLDGSPDFGLDLRGFGTNSAQNLVVLVDGVRLNENELANTTLSTIPVDTVERIEITRGGSSVLYGDGATGGVINIVTRRAAAGGTRGSLFAEAGRFDHLDLRASIAHGAGPWSFDAAVADRRTDNYRDNASYEQTSFSGGVGYAYAPNGRVGLRFESARSDSDLPGSLSEAEYLANPRASNRRTPDGASLDFGSLDTDRVSAYVEHRAGAFDLAAELSHRERELSSTYNYGAASTSLYETEQTQFSPRLRHTAVLGNKRNEFVTGIDLIRWDRQVTSMFSAGNARQDSKAFYLRDELLWNEAHNARLALGARHERFEKEYSDPLAGVLDEDRKRSINAFTVEGSIDVAPQVAVFAKAGRSYRIANIDENSYRSSIDVLAPQTSRDLELGVKAGLGVHSVTARLFQHRLTDEIFYDPTANFGFGANTNLDPTRRQGVEVEGQALLGNAWRLTGQWQYVQAEFRDGPNAGREMILVPKHVVTTRLAWIPGNGQSADIGAQWVDRQRYGNDFDNSCSARIPSYATVDARYARRLGKFEVAVSGLNLFDRQYYSNAFSCRGGIYPSDGRQLKLSVRYDF